MKSSFLGMVFLAGLMACAPAPGPTPPPRRQVTSPAAAPTHVPTSTPGFTPSPSPSPYPSLTPSPHPSPTPSSTPTPYWVALRAEVLERANCRYGPGWMYLYKYGLLPGSVLEVIGRLDDASWLWVRAIGGDNPCWVKADLMDVRGDVMRVAPVYPQDAPLPVSPYYPPVGNVRAVRDGDQVTITWTGQFLRAGDEESPNSPLYVAEIWACQDGQLRFQPYGLFTETLTVTDEGGCHQPSHGQIYFAEKHGYAGPSVIPWPEHGDGTP